MSINEKFMGKTRITRRGFFKLSVAGTAALAMSATGLQIGPDLSRRGLLSPRGLVDAASIALADASYTEVFPTSPLILSPFQDLLPIPKALAPVDQKP